jgi:AcrR family transcriptional regulator
MADEANRASRRYDSTGRKHAAEATRSAILRSARELFTTHGYAATTVAMVAERAGVAQDTVYAGVGTKPAILRLLVETALSERDDAPQGDRRDYAGEMSRAVDARAKLAIYAAAVTAVQGRLAPLFLALRSAASVEPELDRLWREISERRARNMRALVDELATSGQLRPDLTRDQIADIIWTMNSSEYYALLVLDRGWTPEQFSLWLADAWLRLLLR